MGDGLDGFVGRIKADGEGRPLDADELRAARLRRFGRSESADADVLADEAQVAEVDQAPDDDDWLHETIAVGNLADDELFEVGPVDEAQVDDEVDAPADEPPADVEVDQEPEVAELASSELEFQDEFADDWADSFEDDGFFDAPEVVASLDQIMRGDFDQSDQHAAETAAPADEREDDEPAAAPEDADDSEHEAADEETLAIPAAEEAASSDAPTYEPEPETDAAQEAPPEVVELFAPQRPEAEVKLPEDHAPSEPEEDAREHQADPEAERDRKLLGSRVIKGSEFKFWTAGGPEATKARATRDATIASLRAPTSQPARKVSAEDERSRSRRSALVLAAVLLLALIVPAAILWDHGEKRQPPPNVVTRVAPAKKPPKRTHKQPRRRHATRKRAPARPAAPAPAPSYAPPVTTAQPQTSSDGMGDLAPKGAALP